MGRNGASPAVFKDMVRHISVNEGKVMPSQDILMGKKPARNVETSYLYKFIKLGYVEPVGGAKVMDPEAEFKVLKAFPAGYTSQAMKNELKQLNSIL